MTHDEIRDLLLDYCGQDLSADQTTEVEAHLNDCEECRDQVILLRFLEQHGRLVGENLAGRHPSAREITDFALEEGDLGPESRKLISSHVQGCDQCGEFVAFARQVRDLPDAPHSEGTPGRGHVSGVPEPWYRRPIWNFAAAALLLLMLYPAYLGLRGIGQEPRAFVGGQAVVTLRDISMSDEIPEIGLDPAKPYFQLAIFSHHFSNGTRPGDRVRVSLVSVDGTDQALDFEAPYSQLANRDLDRVVTLNIPMEGRRAGDYEVKLENLDRPEVGYRALVRLVGIE